VPTTATAVTSTTNPARRRIRRRANELILTSDTCGRELVARMDAPPTYGPVRSDAMAALSAQAFVSTSSSTPRELSRQPNRWAASTA
jgi:hypothetical protein